MGTANVIAGQPQRAAQLSCRPDTFSGAGNYRQPSCLQSRFGRLHHALDAVQFEQGLNRCQRIDIQFRDVLADAFQCGIINWKKLSCNSRPTPSAETLCDTCGPSGPGASPKSPRRGLEMGGAFFARSTTLNGMPAITEGHMDPGNFGHCHPERVSADKTFPSTSRTHTLAFWMRWKLADISFNSW